MRRSTKRGLLLTVFVVSTTQFMYIYFYGDSSSRIQFSTREINYSTVNGRSTLHHDSHADKSSDDTSSTLTGERYTLPLNNSDNVYPPLLYNMEKFFERPYKPLLYGKRRNKQGFLTVGIPSVRRPNTDKVYVFETLDSLINKTEDSEKANITIVIYMCDMNETYNSIISQAIYNKYQEFCDSGFIHVIQGSQNIYPDLSKVKQTYNDPVPRVKWRAKQNIDFAYLTLYCRNLSRYYLQLEDDVITASGYVGDIQNLIRSHLKKPWFLLEFSKLGFIGKMFRSMDLDRVAFYLLSFYDRMPGDLLLGHIRKLMGQDKPIHSAKSLFQHIGKFSSLKDKLMPSIDKDFKDAGNVHLSSNDIPPGDNPPAKILTSLSQYDAYKPSYAYSNSGQFFWAKDVKKDQHFSLLFQNPQQISRIIVATGDPNKKGDSISKGSVHLAVGSKKSKSPSDLQDCGKFNKFAELVDGDLDTKALGLESKIPSDVICIQIKIDRNQRTWAIFRTISVFLR